MENNQSVNDMYKKYLETKLNIKYSNVYIKRDSARGFWLCSLNDEELTECMDNIKKLENGQYYLGVKWHDNGVDNFFYDSEGKEINVIRDAKISDFCDGMAKVTTIGDNPRCGYVNTKGEVVVEAKWGITSRDFKCGRARVEGVDGREKDKFGFIDKSGKVIIQCNSNLYGEYSDDVVSNDDNNLMRYYDLDGNLLFYELYSAPNFSCGLVRYREGKKFGFLDKTGKVKIKAKYKILGDFNNGIASADGGFIDLSGKKVKVKRETNGVLYIKGVMNNIYYNSCTGKYDKFDMVPFKDLDDYLILVNGGYLTIYCKRDGSYTNTNIKYKVDDKKQDIKFNVNNNDLEIKRVKNMLSINGSNFYLKPGGCISLPSSIDLSRVISHDDDDILSFEEFEDKINQDKYFYREVMNCSKQDEEMKILLELQNKRKEMDAKRQEIINQLQDLKNALQTLDKSDGNLSKINEELLFTWVDDHYEIKPEFIDQLKFLDLHYLDFDNVKVSGIDFGGSNASINPQEVYNKDMSNGIYDGLIFTSKDFTGVNIKNASFKDCNMDFALLDNAIVDDTENSIKF